MFIHVSKVFTGSAAGQRLQSVICEKCGTGFYYQLSRVGIGKGEAPYFLGQSAAAERAQTNAQKDLVRRLELESELVPCPKCQWVNQDLIERYRRRKHRRAPWIAAGIAIAGLIAAWLEWFTSIERKFSTTTLIVLAASLVCAAGVLLIRSCLRQHLDPNRNFPDNPVVPPGTPPALVERRDAQTGQLYLEPGTRQSGDAAGFSEWAVYQAGQVAFPWVCCVCLGKATTFYESPMEVDQTTDLHVPLCRQCSARLTRRWWTAAFIGTACAMGLAGLLAAMVPGIDTLGRWILFVVVALFGWILVLAVVPHRVCRPYRFGVVDADRAVMKFSAKNPKYTELLIRQIV